VHISSGRLPTPLIALSASLLAVSAVLLVALLVHRLVRRRRRRRRLALNAALAAQHDEEGGQALAGQSCLPLATTLAACTFSSRIIFTLTSLGCKCMHGPVGLCTLAHMQQLDPLCVNITS
jgi:hypothetical protein